MIKTAHKKRGRPPIAGLVRTERFEIRLFPLELRALEELCAREELRASRAEMLRRLIARAALAGGGAAK